MNPREMRAEAAKLQAEARAEYEKFKDAEAGMPDEAAHRYDELLDRAEKLIARAESDEAKERRLNELDVRLKGQGAGDGGQRPDARPDNPLPHQDPANARGRDYSLIKALRQMASKGQEPLDGLEAEVSQEIAVRTKRPPNGFFMPTDLAVRGRSANPEYRDITTSTGSGAKATILQGGTWIELLRTQTLARQLGVRIMADMVGDFAIPKKTAGGTAYWVTEGNAPTESTQTVGQLLFQPSTIGAYSDISRKFLIQSSFDAEMFVREDLAEVIAIELDRVTFNGSGSGAEPEGIIPNSNVNVVPIDTNGGALTWAKLVAMETALATQNAPNGYTAFVTNPAVRGAARLLQRFSSTDTPLWDGDEVLGSYPAFASNQIPANLSKGSASGTLSAAILGVWNQAIWAFWTGVDVLVDTITGGTAGTVRVIMLQDADFQIRQVKAFSVIKDIIP